MANKDKERGRNKERLIWQPKTKKERGKGRGN